MADIANETPADIAAEIRKQAEKERSNSIRMRKWNAEDDVDRALANAYDEDAKYLACIADRIEAAARRERAELEAAATSKMLEGATIIDNRGHGNAAAMREALEDVQERMVAGVHSGSVDCHDALEVVEKALSAPPRNCDRFKKWKEAWDYWLEHFPSKETRVHSGTIRFLEWLFAPANVAGAAGEGGQE